MKADIISIGDELLIGQVVNTNASWLAQKINQLGFEVRQITIIPDNRENILWNLDHSLSKADLVITTGGLGPTSDDITKKTFCEFFETGLVFDQRSYQDISDFFAKKGKPVSELNRQQAEIPEICRPIRNLHGTAPGMWFEEGEKVVVALPGVPFEMMPMVENYAIPWLKEKCSLPPVVHKTVLTTGMEESFLADRLSEWEKQLPSSIKLAYLPSAGIIRLRLSASGEKKEKITDEIDSQIDKLKQVIPELIFGYNDDTLESIINTQLTGINKTLSVAESCTGGYLSHKITSVPGSSAFFKGAVIAYSNEIKENTLGVDSTLLEQYGALSEQVAKAMAENVRSRYNTDYAVAVTGIAGPSGETPEKPVGKTWIAVTGVGGTVVQNFLFGDNRERNIRRSAIAALNMLRKYILEQSA